MEDPTRILDISKQEKSEAVLRHRQERFWQIIFPLLIASILIFAAFVYLLASESNSSETIAGLGQTATVLLTLPILLLMLVTLILVIVFIWLISRLMGWIPNVSKSALDFMKNMQTSVTKITTIVVKPILLINQKTAEVQRLVNCLRPKSKAGRKT